MSKSFGPWSFLICHRTNETPEDQEYLQEVVIELEKNTIWKKKGEYIVKEVYFKRRFYRRKNRAQKYAREIKTKGVYE